MGLGSKQKEDLALPVDLFVLQHTQRLLCLDALGLRGTRIIPEFPHGVT
jgi:hypothetical protein